MTLTEFLLARIADDEAVARQANPHHNDDIDDWGAQTDAEARWDRQPHGQRCAWRLGEGMADKCECGYPARVLAECEAKRRIVDIYRSEWEMDPINETLRLLALPYADHPDYDEKWRP